MKNTILYWVFPLLLFQSCIVPSRFSQSSALLTDGSVGAGLSFSYITDQDTMSPPVFTASIGAHFQESERLTTKFGLANLLSPYAGADYRFINDEKFKLISGLDMGLLDGSLIWPVKMQMQINSFLNYELACRFAVNIYNWNYDALYGESPFVSFSPSLLAPQYWGLDTGLNVALPRQNNIGIRFGYYQYKNLLTDRFEPLMVFTVNTLINPPKTIRQRRIWFGPG